MTLLYCLLACSLLQADSPDWPMYNRDVAGSRHNSAERTLSPANVGQLTELWRFPPSGEEIGVVHATPIIVDGCAYFGTASDPSFYKLSPEGKRLWSYRNPGHTIVKPRENEKSTDTTYRNRRFQSSPNGILGSALVQEGSVYFADIGGWVCALDANTGKEKWKLNLRGNKFPHSHPLNCIFSSPMLLDGKLIVAGGTLEQVVAAFPGYKASSGRGFVMALNPDDGALQWIYHLGPKPEKLDPPMVLEDGWGKHTFHFGPATSSVWSTPSYDAATKTLFFGTDVNTAPRRPSADNPRFDTPESCGIIALDVANGQPRWITQISPNDVWTNAMRSYDPKEGRYKDQSIGDTPKLMTIPVNGVATKVVGAGSKNGGFYLLDAGTGKIITHTPIFTGPPSYPLQPTPDPRTLALPSLIGGLQTGCATDGQRIYTNGIDALLMGATEQQAKAAVPPTGGRVTAISLDTATEFWRHERPKVASVGGPAPKTEYKNIGDPVASGIAVANGVVYFTTQASGKFLALDAATGKVLKEVDLGPVWSGPSVSRGRVYVGTGNTLFNPFDFEAYFPKKMTGSVHCFGVKE